MADVEQEKTGVNSQEASVDSPPAAAQVENANPPAEENSVADNKPENKVPQSRFNEVIEQRNKERELRERYESRIRDLESRQSVSPQQRESVVDREVKKLVAKHGMDEKAARDFVESAQAVSRAERQELERQMGQRDIMAWGERMAKDDPDYKALEPELDRAFAALPPQKQELIASDIDLLNMFYGNVKSSVAARKVKEAYQDGAKAAYEGKAAKQAVASIPGASANAKRGISRKDILNMSNEEYTKRLPEINEAIRNGTLK